jgi:hypothetical protein
MQLVCICLAVIYGAASTAYAFAPFALREALLYGGNVPQLLAIGLFPWTLWAMTRAARTRSWAWATTAAFFYAAILLTHLFHALIFTPVAGLYSLILSSQPSFPSPTSKPSLKTSPFTICGRRPWWQAIRNLLFTIRNSQFPLPSPYALIALPLGLLLSTFFWLPAFTERVFTRAQAGIYLEKSPFYVRYPDWTELTAWIYPLDSRAANPYVPLTLGVVTFILAGLGLTVGIMGGRGLGVRGQRSPDPRLLPAVFFAVVAAAATFMTLPVSRPVWEIVSILQVAEFPWRMLGLANLGLAFLAGGAVTGLPAKLRWPVTLLCVAIQIVAIAPLLYPTIGFTRYEPLTLASQIDYERRSQSIGTTTLGEYLPQTVTRPPTTSPLVETFQTNQHPERLDYGSLPAGATATLVKQTAVTHGYRLESPAAFTLRFLQFDYPGWQAQLDGQPTLIQPEVETGLIMINIPAGRHDLVVHFGETPGRVFALTLTGLTLLGLIGAGVARRLTVTSHQLSVNSQQSIIVKDTLPRSPALLLTMLLIITVAFWLKPLLRPVFTVNSPPDQALPAQHPIRLDFANGIQLIGYDLDSPVIPAGGRAQVVLYWQTNAAPLKTNLQPFVHLDRLDNLTTVADATNYTPGDATTESVLPTFHWDNARYVRDEHDLMLPPGTPPLAYAVRVGLLDPDQAGQLIPLAGNSGDTAQLTIINVTSAGQSPPQLAEPIRASFQAGQAVIQLTGFELDSLTPAQLDFRLAWQATQTPPTDYIVFAQLLDGEHNLAANFDRPPLNGAYPTSTWLPNQVIIDPRFIPLPGVPLGEYRLIVGLYDQTTQQRLLTATGADFVELTKVQVGQ